MIQDIYPHKMINHYDPEKRASLASPVFWFQNEGMLSRAEDGTLRFPLVSELGITSSEDNLRYLFSIDDEDYYLLLSEPEGILVPEGYAFRTIREIRGAGIGTGPASFAAMTATHLVHWYSKNRFCGKCGSPLRHHAKERAMECPSCRNVIYPRIMPAVIVGVKKGDSLLLTRYARGFRNNALIAGFTEIGETLEETVEREVMEEVGIRVRNIRYYKSQPWGMADDILMGFYCEADGDARIRMDQEELGYAAFVKREEIVLQPDDYSLTNEMMKRFKEGLEK